MSLRTLNMGVVAGGSGIILSGNVSIALFGNSITAGTGSTNGLGFRDDLATAIALALPGVTVTWVGPYGTPPLEHGGDPGATISGIETNFSAWITGGGSADIVLVQAGTNDAADIGVPYVGSEAALRYASMLETMLASVTHVGIVTPPTVNPASIDPADEALRLNLADFAPRAILEARKLSCLYVDLHAASLSWIASDFADDVHESDSGNTKHEAVIRQTVINLIGRQLAPSRNITLPEIVTDPTISAPVIGSPAVITPGAVDAFPQVTNTFRILDSADDSEIADVGTDLVYTPTGGDLGLQLRVEQTSGADIRIGPASVAVASPIAFPTTDLVLAFEARSDVTESGGRVSSVGGQHGTTAIATAAGAAQPDYRVSDGYLGGPAFRFGAPSTGGDATLLNVNENLLAAPGDCTISFLYNSENVTTGAGQWLLGHDNLYGPLHMRSNTVPRASWWDGTYDSLAIPNITGWQLLTFQVTGTTLRIYRGRSQIGTDLTITPRALLNPKIGNVAAGGSPLDGLIEGVWAWDSSITLSGFWDWAQQEWPGIAV